MINLKCDVCKMPANKYFADSKCIYLCDTHAAMYGYCYLCSKKQKFLLNDNGMCYNCYDALSERDEFIE